MTRLVLLPTAQSGGIGGKYIADVRAGGPVRSLSAVHRLDGSPDTSLGAFPSTCAADLDGSGVYSSKSLSQIGS